MRSKRRRECPQGILTTPQSKIGSEVPIFASSPMRGAKGAAIERNDKSEFEIGDIMGKRILKIVLIVLSYVLVAAVAVGLTLVFGSNKLTQLELLLKTYYVDRDTVDYDALEDAAAAAMMDALPDGWSYYVSAQQYEDYENDRKNSFVGVGITIQANDAGQIEIVKVSAGSGAEAAGILPGDILVSAGGQDLTGISVDAVSTYVRGEEGSAVELGVLRDGTAMTFTVERSRIQVQVVTSAMVADGIGYVRIENFHERSAEDAIAAVEELRSQGAKALIFDVRGNGGGYKDELVKLLDHLLPEGDLFCSVDYSGKKEVDTSDASCVELPMAVLMDGNSYSAAEFFPAALEEYDWAITVGKPTVGKGHFQQTFRLPDGSAVAISTGKYYTPKGVSLSEAGGLTPNVMVEMEDEAKAKLYSGILPYEEDPQLQAAIEVLKQ